MDRSAISNYKVVAFVFMGETERGDHVLTLVLLCIRLQINYTDLQTSKTLLPETH